MPSASTSAPPRRARWRRKPSATCWWRRPARAASSRASSGATRSCSIEAARKRCSSTNTACRSRSCPGIPAAIGIPAYGGVPVTYPGAGDTLTLVRGHEDESQTAPQVDWSALAKLKGTIVCYAGHQATAGDPRRAAVARTAQERCGRGHLRRHAAGPADGGRHPRATRRAHEGVAARNAPRSSSSARSRRCGSTCAGSTNGRCSASGSPSHGPERTRRIWRTASRRSAPSRSSRR